MKISDLIAILSVVVAVCAAVAGPQLETVFPGHGAYLSAVLTVVGLAAAAIIRTLTNKTGAPAASVAVNPQTGNVDVTHPNGTPTGATLVTTTSTEPTTAPLASAAQVPQKDAI